eukprot:TRINITY_DN58931_c0_g1_i1.p1 TRINITY_DN58931_c0_g1~~TRINITY_DN58931_c0_g1_i1.p1  ORF type:complete len:209 (-),score=28.05 TRINITY_DN58931_c0_g1_i1:16-642(-)
MGCLCCKYNHRTLPSDNDPMPDPNLTEWQIFEKLVGESLDDPSIGWQLKRDFSPTYKNDFKVRIAVKPDKVSGNPNYILRGDLKYRGVRPEDHLKALVDPVDLPGFQEMREVQVMEPDASFIKYLRVKAPGLTARDHCWKYTIDRGEDGSIFCCIRSTTHPDCPVRPGVIRAYYYNATLMTMSKDEPGVMCFTEFIQQDLKGADLKTN